MRDRDRETEKEGDRERGDESGERDRPKGGGGRRVEDDKQSTREGQRWRQNIVVGGYGSGERETHTQSCNLRE